MLAFKHMKEKGIMHRDIKAHNIAIDHQEKKVRIIDWDSAEYYVKGTAYPFSQGTWYYKAPELLLGQSNYDFAVDMWALGATFGGMIFNKLLFFENRDLKNRSELNSVVSMLGSSGLESYI